MTIKVTYVPSMDMLNCVFTPEELGVTEEQWNDMNEDDRADLLNDACGPEQPYWFLSKYEER